MRQDRPRPCASYPVSYAYTAYSCEYIFISFSRCPGALTSSAAALLSPERRWSQLPTHTPAARIPTCPGRLLVRADALVSPAHLQRACLRAARYLQTSLADRHIQDTAAHDLVPLLLALCPISMNIIEPNAAGYTSSVRILSSIVRIYSILVRMNIHILQPLFPRPQLLRCATTVSRTPLVAACDAHTRRSRTHVPRPASRP